MIRFLIRFALLIAAAAFFAWLADRPGAVAIDWMGLHIETPLVAAVMFLLIAVVLVVLLWRAAALLLGAPGGMSGWWRGKRQRRGETALVRGLVAAGAGDIAAARRHAATARRVLGARPLVSLLEAQTAQAAGDSPRLKQIFADMAERTETRLLGLRGLFHDAQEKGDVAAARRHAEQALAVNPGLPWAGRAVLAVQSASGDWASAERTIAAQRKAGSLAAGDADRLTAVVLTARAQAAASAEPDAALELARRAVRLDPALVPAAELAARLLIARGAGRKAARLLEKAWAAFPHPVLADLYARQQQGAAPAERLKRIRALLAQTPAGEEGAAALARAAIEARDFAAARDALAPYASDRPASRICTLMAAIAEGEGDAGLAREWLARAVHAPRDAVWTADGHISEVWLPASPVTGELGAFRWRVPVARIGADPEGFAAVLSAPAAAAAAAAPPAAVLPAPARISPDERGPLPPVPDDPGPDPDGLAFPGSAAHARRLQAGN